MGQGRHWNLPSSLLVQEAMFDACHSLTSDACHWSSCGALCNVQLESCQSRLGAKQNPAFGAFQCSSRVKMSPSSDKAAVTMATVCIFSAASFSPCFFPLASSVGFKGWLTQVAPCFRRNH